MKISDFPIKKDRIRKYDDEKDFYRATTFVTEWGEVTKMLYYCDQLITYSMQLNQNTKIVVNFKPPKKPDIFSLLIHRDIPIEIISETDLDREIEECVMAKNLVLLVKELAQEDFVLWDVPKWDRKSLKEAGYDFTLLI